MTPFCSSLVRLHACPFSRLFRPKSQDASKKEDEQKKRGSVRRRLGREGNRREPAPVQVDNPGKPADEQEPQVRAGKRAVLARQEDGEAGPGLVLPPADPGVHGHGHALALRRQQEQLAGQVGGSVRLHLVPASRRQEESPRGKRGSASRARRRIRSVKRKKAVDESWRKKCFEKRRKTLFC